MADFIFSKRLERPGIFFFEVPSPVKEASDGRLKLLVWLMEKCSCLDEVPDY